MTSSNQKKGTICLVLATVLISMAAFSENTENATEEQRISRVLKQFINSIRERDIIGIQNTLDESIAIVEASSSSSKIEIINSNAFKDILPPLGNDDWEKAAIGDISVTISKTHPSAAMVSFTIKFPIGEKELKGLQEIPAEVMKSLNDEQRKNIEQMIQEKSINAAMFALLAKRQGNWKIVSITFPK